MNKFKAIYSTILTAILLTDLHSTFKQEEPRDSGVGLPADFPPFEAAISPETLHTDSQGKAEPTDAELAAEAAKVAEAEKKLAEEAAKNGDKVTKEEQEKKKEDAVGDKPAETEEIVYKIGEKELTAEDIAKVNAKMEEKFGADFLKNMPADKLQVLTQEYINILEGSKNLAAKNQEVSKKDRALDKEKEKLDTDRTTLTAKLDEANLVLAAIQEKREEYKKIKETKETDIFDDDERLTLKVKKTSAAERDAELEQREKALKETIKGFQNTETDIYYMSVLNEIQTQIPELMTSRDVLDINQDVLDGKIDEYIFIKDEKDLTPEEIEVRNEAIIADRVKMIFNGYLALKAKDPETKLTVRQFYAAKKHNLPALPKTTAQPGKKKTVLEIKAEKLFDTFEKIKKSQKENPAIPAGGGEQHSTERTNNATTNSANDYWKELGYAPFDSL